MKYRNYTHLDVASESDIRLMTKCCSFKRGQKTVLLLLHGILENVRYRTGEENQDKCVEKEDFFEVFPLKGNVR